MFKLTRTGHNGEKTMFETPNEKEMAAYIFYCGHYKQPIVMDGYVDLHLPDGQQLSDRNMDKWVENAMPEETTKFKQKREADKGFIRSKLIKYGMVKSHVLQYLENALENQKFFEKKMGDRTKLKM